MRTNNAALLARTIVVGGLGALWLIGLVLQRMIVEETGYLDVPPPLLLLGMLLCALAGAGARVVAPHRRRVRTGALAGIAMVAGIIVGYLGLAVAYGDRFDPSESGETWWSLLLESWFWVGVPLLVSAGLGTAGWRLADRLSGPRVPRQPDAPAPR